MATSNSRSSKKNIFNFCVCVFGSQAAAGLKQQLEEEAAARREEAERVAQLEGYKQQLEELLEQERQAKKDEEIVRNLQAKYVLPFYPGI